MADDVGFPLNIVDAIANRLTESTLLTVLDDPPVKRPLRLSDPAKSLGIYPYNWLPTGQLQIGQHGPSINRYLIRIQSMVKGAGNEVETRALYTGIAKMVRVVLDRDPDLQVALGNLSETLLGTIERAQRWSVQEQRYLTNEFQRGRFTYLATTEFWLETEITAL